MSKIHYGMQQIPHLIKKSQGNMPYYQYAVLLLLFFQKVCPSNPPCLKHGFTPLSVINVHMSLKNY